MDDERTDEVISRAYLLADELREMVRRCSPGSAMLTEAERAASLRAALDAQPDRGSGAWLFCYGSLVWNPTVRADQRRVAAVAGWHRAFCLATRAGRGTADNPGLVLGLRPGGDCTGLALHIPKEALEAELDLLWRREMITGAYIPAWLEALDPGGAPIGPALAFTVDPAHENVVDWPEERVVAALATAAGELGSSADYLFRTRDGLRSVGIDDELIERLSLAVQARRATA
jgi:cation transport protein ChaC